MPECRVPWNKNGKQGVYPRIKGVAPPFVQLVSSESVRSRDRDVVTKAWNGKYASEKVLNNISGKNTHTCATTPFRAVNNAGDYLGRRNYTCGGGTQTNASRPGLARLIGNVHSNKCDGSHIPPSTCNTAFVYDSSDYTRFRKLQAKNRNFNDISFGGDNNNGSYVSFMRVKR